MSAETVAAEQHIAFTLSHDATMLAAAPGGFHSERQHQAKLGNYVLYNMLSAAPDLTGEGGIRIYATLTFLVRMVGLVQSYTPLQAGADRIDQLLHLHVPAQYGSYLVPWTKRLRPYELTEHFLDKEWRHLGGVYQIVVQP